MENDILLALDKEARKNNLDPAGVKAFAAAETGGKGFAEDTGKILIQFEPAWFRKKAPYAPSGAWSLNGVERQNKEWLAFNDAFAKNKDAAMQSTSIGLGQIMGFHYQRLGYAGVGAMWDDAKKGIDRQVFQMVKFLMTDPMLKNALKPKPGGLTAEDFYTMASRYNGAGFEALAKKIGREPYNLTIARNYKKYNI